MFHKIRKVATKFHKAFRQECSYSPLLRSYCVLASLGIVSQRYAEKTQRFAENKKLIISNLRLFFGLKSTKLNSYHLYLILFFSLF